MSVARFKESLLAPFSTAVPQDLPHVTFCSYVILHFYRLSGYGIHVDSYLYFFEDFVASYRVVFSLHRRKCLSKYIFF